MADRCAPEAVRTWWLSAPVEIDMLQRFSEHYSYAFCTVQPND